HPTRSSISRSFSPPPPSPLPLLPHPSGLRGNRTKAEPIAAAGHGHLTICDEIRSDEASDGPRAKMSPLGGFRRWLQRKQYHFEVTLSVYMFTPWEKFAFYSILFLLFSLAFIAAILYLPHHVSILAGRAWYYIQGEDIDVVASAREAAKEISAGVLSGEALPTAARVQGAFVTADKEL
ncbi:Uncharacterized protein TCAP_05100, partial [Tolypocladium capitatum]